MTCEAHPLYRIQPEGPQDLTGNRRPTAHGEFPGRTASALIRIEPAAVQNGGSMRFAQVEDQSRCVSENHPTVHSLPNTGG